MSEMAGDERTSATDIAEVIELDPALTARVLQPSNSALYGGVRRISTARDAIVRLGFEKVRGIVLAASLVQNFRYRARGEDDLDPTLFWAHSLVVALAAEAVARVTDAASPDQAFTAGIIHDIGRLALRVAFPAEVGRAVARARSGNISLAEAERDLTGYDHGEIGSALAERWLLPKELVLAIARHHDPTARTETDQLAGVLAQSHRWALHHGFYSGYEPETQPPSALPVDREGVEKAVGGVGRVLSRTFALMESVTGKTWALAEAA